MVITINIPKGYTEDITINLRQEADLPFADGYTNEEAIEQAEVKITQEELKEYAETPYNDMWQYLAKNMGEGVAPLGTFDEDMNEVIPIE